MTRFKDFDMDSPLSEAIQAWTQHLDGNFIKQVDANNERIIVTKLPFHEVSDDELTRLIDTVKVRPPPPPPPPPARMGMSQGPIRDSLVMEALVKNLRKKWGKMR